MAKKKTEKTPRPPTKKQITQWQKQERRQRLIFWSGVFVVATAILLMSVGWYFSHFRLMQEVVLKVDGTPYKMSYFVNMLEYYGEDNLLYYPYIADNLAESIKRNQIVRTAAEELGCSFGGAPRC